ncbi:MAG TPA: SDR family oxidoreductase [Gemmatimonadaceae bacterium]|nr:SDR family oxidoreductase [Gemmatimonadaceae bacterium]
MKLDTVAGTRVLITGAAMGMGRIYAERAVAERAAAVVLWDVNRDALEATAGSLRAQGGVVHTFVVDLSHREAIANAAADVRREIGDIDILFNNAGIVRGKYFWEHEAAGDIELTMAVNALAPMYVAREFLPAMIANRRESRIVNIASASGLVSVPRMSVYGASKWAVTGWSDSLRLELQQAGHRHVRVTTVNPTYIGTGMFAGAKPMVMTPIMTPEYVTGRVWRAMKRGTPRLWLPKSVYLSAALKGILPLRAFDWMADRVFGVYRSMESFTGRK